MATIRLIEVAKTFGRCNGCGWLNRPVILCSHTNGDRPALYCMRCFHVLAAPAQMTTTNQGGA